MRSKAQWPHRSTWPPSTAVRQVSMAAHHLEMGQGQVMPVAVAGAVLTEDGGQLEGWHGASRFPYAVFRGRPRPRLAWGGAGRLSRGEAVEAILVTLTLV